MAKNRTAKSCYPSRFGNGWITAQQYIAEIVCERRFKKDGKDVIPEYWKQADWAKICKYQNILASGLLKIHDAKAIINALNSKDGQGIFSLNNKFLDGIIEREAVKLSQLDQQCQNTIKSTDVKVEDEKPRPTFIGNNEFKKLRDL